MDLPRRRLDQRGQPVDIGCVVPEMRSDPDPAAAPPEEDMLLRGRLRPAHRPFNGTERKG